MKGRCMNKKWIVSGVLLLSLGIIGCIFSGFSTPQVQLTITSSSFNNGGKMHRRYTCDGTNISPALSWQISDATTVKSYVLIVDDPDAQKVAGKTFVHWIVLMSAAMTQLSEGISKQGSPARDRDVIELANDYGKAWYQGPCPPEGKGEHIYQFTLFAMNVPVDKVRNSSALKAPYTAQHFEEAMRKDIVARAQMTGRYRR